MALLAAGARLHTNTCRTWGGNAVAGIYGLGVTANSHTFVRGSGVLLNRAFPKASIPEGHGHPAAWKLPQKPGAMSSRFDAILTVSTTAQGWMGLPGEASASFAITVPDATGGLIASGTGSSSLTITVGNLLLTASLNGTGSATWEVTTNTPILGAEASLIASASFQVTGGLTPYAIGILEGTTVDLTGVTPASIWGYTLEGSYTAAQVQRLIASALAGKVSGAASNAPVFRDLADTKDRITATTDASGNRTAITLDAD